MKVALLDNTALSNAVHGARICYNSFGPSKGDYSEPTDVITAEDLKLLDRLIHKHGHASVTRHVKYVFKVEGISTKTLLALSRHQIGLDLSVMSSRFCKLDKFGNSYTKTPNEEVNKLLAKHIEEISQIEGASAEDLAMLYPQAMQYDLILTMNPQSLQHFVDMRYGKDSHAHFDIQLLAELLLKAVPLTHNFMYKIP